MQPDHTPNAPPHTSELWVSPLQYFILFGQMRHLSNWVQLGWESLGSGLSQRMNRALSQCYSMIQGRRCFQMHLWSPSSSPGCKRCTGARSCPSLLCPRAEALVTLTLPNLCSTCGGILVCTSTHAPNTHPWEYFAQWELARDWDIICSQSKQVDG